MTRLLPLLLLGCTGSVPVVLHASAENQADGRATVEEAADLFGPLHVDTEGPLHLFVVDTDMPGIATWRRGCKRLAEASDGACPIVGAHELGHLLGLGHTDPDSDRHNVMHPSPLAPASTTDRQRRRTERALDRLALCP